MNMQDFMKKAREEAGMTESEDFFSKPMTPGQFRSYRAARSEGLHTAQRLRGSGFENEVDEILADKPGIWETMTQPVFDALQMGQFVTAGAALEIQKNGMSWDVFKRAASELANALPGIDETDAEEMTGFKPTRPSFLSRSSRSSGVQFFNEEGAGKWSAAAGGLVLDILLDPITWVNPLAYVGKINAVSKGVEAAKTAAGATRFGAGVGRRFDMTFDLKQFGRKVPELKDSVEKFIYNKAQKDRLNLAQSVEMRDMLLKLADGMTPAERRLMELYLDQPQVLDGLLQQVAKTPDELVTLRDKAKALTDNYRDILAEGKEYGLFDSIAMDATYSPGRSEMTDASRNAMKELFDKLGYENIRRHSDFISDFGPGAKGIPGAERQLGQGVPGFAKPKKYSTKEERVIDGMGTELDAILVAGQRNFEHIRWRNTHNFINATLSDPLIARSIDDADFLAAILKDGRVASVDELVALGKTGEEAQRIHGAATQFTRALEEKGMGVYRPLRKKQSAEDLIKGGMAPEKADMLERMSTSFVMPKPFIKELGMTEDMLRGKGEARKFFDHVMTVQNLWKGYAVLSPGFHMRNMYSNVWLNTLGGVDNPAWYVRALRLQRGKGDDVAIKMADGTEVAGQGIVKLAKEHGILDTGMYQSELGETIETQLNKGFSLSASRGDTEGIIERIAAHSDETKLFKGKGNKKQLVTTRGELQKMVAETSPDMSQGESMMRLWNPFNAQNPVLRANRKLGQAFENNARLTHFMDKLSKGYSVENAAKSVKKYLYNYNELTEFERDIMKTVLPFYAWMRFNIPNMMASVLEKPGRFAALSAKPIQAVESLSEDWKDLSTPDYFAELHAVRMPKGVAKFISQANKGLADVGRAAGLDIPDEATGLQPTYINPNLPFQDINKGNWRDILASMSPIFKIPIEAATGGSDRGFSFFQDRPIERYTGQPGELPFIPGTDFRVRRQTENAVNTLLPTVGKIQRMRTKVDRGQAVSQMLTEFAGIKLMQVDLKKEERNAAYRRKEKLRNLQMKARELGVIP
jgi:hypothetical protein